METRKTKRFCLLTKFLAAVSILAVLLCFPLCASAENDYLIIPDTLAYASEDDYIYYIGLAVNWDGTTYIVSGPFGDYPEYLYLDTDDNYHDMQKIDNPPAEDGMEWFVPYEEPYGTVLEAGVGSIGQQYALLFVNTEDGAAAVGTISFGSYSANGYLYQASDIEYDLGGYDGFYSPAIIVGENDTVIGYISNTAVFLFEEPTGGGTTGGGETDGTTGGGTSDGGESGGGSTNGGSTGGGESGGGSTGGGSTGGGSTNGGNSGDQNYNKIWYIVAGAVIVALIVVILMKNKGQTSSDSSASQGQVIDLGGPPTIPVSDASAPSYEKPVHHDNTGWFIQIEGGIMNGYIYPIHNGTTIGRNPDCEIRYPADTRGISRRHCRFSIRDGGIYVTDLGSTSGTFIRGVGQLSPNVPKHIHQGDVLYLGEKKNVIVIRSNS